jgi:hypothetical protein
MFLPSEGCGVPHQTSGYESVPECLTDMQAIQQCLSDIEELSPAQVQATLAAVPKSAISALAELIRGKTRTIDSLHRFDCSVHVCTGPI